MELARTQRRVLRGCILLGSLYVGFRVAVDVYSGPSVLLGFAITAGVAAILCVSFVYLPESARNAVAYLAGLLLQ